MGKYVYIVPVRKGFPGTTLPKPEHTLGPDRAICFGLSGIILWLYIGRFIARLINLLLTNCIALLFFSCSNGLSDDAGFELFEEFGLGFFL